MSQDRKNALVSASRWAGLVFVLYNLGIVVAALFDYIPSPIRLFDPLITALIMGWWVMEFNDQGIFDPYFTYQGYDPDDKNTGPRGAFVFSVSLLVTLVGCGIGILIFGMIKALPWIIGSVGIIILIDSICSSRFPTKAKRIIDWLNNK